jgi:hypothetical protein
MGRAAILTRGKTARDRLHRADTWVARESALRLAAAPLYVDFGFGAEPSTTVETYRRLSAVVPGLRVIGVEIDEERVEAALLSAIPGRLDFRLGGFDLPIDQWERAGVVRAINVLRGCNERQYHDAVDRLGRGLRDGGVLLEGTSSPTGRLLAANVYRRRGAGLTRDGLLLAPNLAREWQPREFEDVLPRDVIGATGAGSWFDDFFDRWDKSLDAARDAHLSPRAAFVSAAAELGEEIDHDPALVRRGFLLVHLPVSVPSFAR